MVTRFRRLGNWSGYPIIVRVEGKNRVEISGQFNGWADGVVQLGGPVGGVLKVRIGRKVAIVDRAGPVGQWNEVLNVNRHRIETGLRNYIAREGIAHSRATDSSRRVGIVNLINEHNPSKSIKHRGPGLDYADRKWQRCARKISVSVGVSGQGPGDGEALVFLKSLEVEEEEALVPPVVYLP